jgi:orotidine-5'-phosphate decarboxylase
MEAGWIEGACGLLINASRSILYASSSDDYASAAAAEAQKLQEATAPYFTRTVSA